MTDIEREREDTREAGQSATIVRGSGRDHGQRDPRNRSGVQRRS